LSERARVCFRRTTLSPHAFEAPDEDVGFSRKPQLGLGISDAPLPPEKSPVSTPAIETMEKGQATSKDEATSRSGKSQNITHRLEEKLWKYSTSGNSAMRWRLEIISWLVSAACMGAIVLALIIVRDKPTPRWHGLTLNAYISELSKIACAALLLPVSEALGQLKWLWFQGKSNKMWDFEIFDNASRGPWGSFVLLVRTKGTSLAALGAAITIFSMALDPFFQQLVTYPTRLVLNPSLNSTIPRIVQYRPTYDTAWRDGIEMLQFEQELQAEALKFLYQAAKAPAEFENDVRPSIPLSCPTGNCTWPVYNTLGMCSKCADISDLLTYGCHYGSLDWIANTSRISDDKVTNFNGTMCGWFINGTSAEPGAKPILMSGHRKATPELPNEESLLTRILPLTKPVNRLPLYGDGSYHFKDYQNTMLDFFVVSAADSPNSTYLKVPPAAQECILAWCVKTMRSTYIQANYSEQVTNVFFNRTTGLAYPWKSTAMNTSMGMGYDIRYQRDIHINYNGTEFGASLAAHTRSTFFFEDYFPSIFLKFNYSDEPLLRFKMQYVDGGPPFLRNATFNPFAASNNVTRHMQSMAKGMTDTLRSSNGQEPFAGEAYGVESYVHVRWGWLSLPLGLLVLTLFFLVGTVVRSSVVKDDVGVWKTSAVATLLYGLPDNMQKKIAALAPEDGTCTPRMKARSLEISMLPTKKGWRASGDMLGPFTPKLKPTQPPPGWI
jgi:hypothetical protein